MYSTFTHHLKKTIQYYQLQMTPKYIYYTMTCKRSFNKQKEIWYEKLTPLLEKSSHLPNKMLLKCQLKPETEQ